MQFLYMVIMDYMNEAHSEICLWTAAWLGEGCGAGPARDSHHHQLKYHATTALPAH